MKKVKIFLVLLLIITSLFSNQTKTYAESKKVIKVGFPIQNGLTYKDENGNYAGYTVDYLKELTQYFDYTVEYVEVEGDINTQLSKLLKMLQTGEIDMLGAMNRNDQLEEMFLYPSYNYGVAYTTLAVKEDSQNWIEEDFKNWNGIRIATYPGLEKRMQYLEQYAAVNGFTYELVEFNSLQETYNAVLTGQADATLQVDISMSTGLRAIARFSPYSYYFALNKQRTDLLQEVNSALYSVIQAYPYIQNELYNKHFIHNDQYYISKENMEYIDNLEPLKVLFFNGNLPIQSGNNGKGSGIAATIFEEFYKATGFKYEVVIANGYEEGLELVKTKQVDLVAAVPANSLLVAEGDLRLTRPYFNSYGVFVKMANAQVESQYNVQNLAAYTKQRLKKINNKEITGSFMDGYSVSYYLRQKGLYDKVSVEWKGTENIYYSIGLLNHVDEELLKMLNHFASTFTQDKQQKLLYDNSQQELSYSFDEFIYAHRIQLTVGGLFAFIIVYLFIIISRNKKLLEMKTEYEKFHQFSKLVSECLFEYNYKTDILYIHNNQFVFAGNHEICHFRNVFKNYIFEDEEKKAVNEILYNMIFQKEPTKEVLIKVKGRDFWFKIEMSYSTEKGQDYVVGRIYNVDQDVRVKKELEVIASTDYLTGLNNRSSLENYLKKFLNNRNTYGAMMLFDIDNFKLLNDGLGHAEGDKFLKQFANIISQYFGDGDMKSRLGGDEFIVFIPEDMSEEVIENKLKDLILILKNDLFEKYKQFNISVSIGVTFASNQEHTYEELYKNADNAMYKAKNRGKNGYYIQKKS